MSSLTFRALRRHDFAEVGRHLLRLSDEDLTNRFCQRTTRADIDAYVDSIDEANDLLLGAVDHQNRCHGLLHATPLTRMSLFAALSIEPQLRRRGLANFLVRSLLAEARLRGFRSVMFDHLQYNEPAFAFARRLPGARTVPDSEQRGLLRTSIDLAVVAPAKPATAAEQGSAA